MSAYRAVLLLSAAHDDFVTLDEELSPAAARDLLGARRVGLVTSGGAVTASVGAADLDRATRAGVADLRACGTTVILVAADVGLAEFADSDAVTLLDLGAAAIVLLDGERVVAVAPATMVDDYLATGGYYGPSRTMGGPHGGNADGELHGRVRTGVAQVRCARPGCGAITPVTVYDPGALPWCAGDKVERHRLVVARVPG